ncbi:MAG: bifunctional diaminohydroxyphosphoribosylaminopyrimidine deaminase/5-amino-6-(5-phosphoribosylamino)uracil reductase RibD [Pseudonocardiales bacterium]
MPSSPRWRACSMNWLRWGRYMASALERDAMRRAIVLSAFGLGTTSPNPPVGCVILDTNGQIVGEGYHERKGEPHAETQALAAAGERARDGSAVVTLEPCNHYGRTPPCCQALIEAGIARVIISIIDPTSRGEGGAAALRSAGVDVEVCVLDDEARLVLGPWLAALEHKRPFVTLGYTVDGDGLLGGLPTADRSSAHEAVMDALDLRFNHDAVLLASGRIEEGVPGGHGRGVFKVVPESPEEASELLTSLANGGVRSLLVDGASPLADSLEAGWVDQAVAYIESKGPTSVGQASADSRCFGGLVTGLALQDVTRVGRAVRVSSIRRTHMNLPAIE